MRRTLIRSFATVGASCSRNFSLRGLLEHRFLHADPNLANFAFLEDGRVVVYDFGSVKEIPEGMAKSYAGLLVATAHGRRDDIAEILKEMGMFMNDGSPMPLGDHPALSRNVR